MSSAHECDALVISCIDYRFITKIRNFLINKGFKDNYDLITVPGASLNLEKIIEDIDVSFKLHQPRRVFIFDHEDCGAYGTDNSDSRHHKNLSKARNLLKRNEHKLEINTLFVKFDEIKQLN